MVRFIVSLFFLCLSVGAGLWSQQDSAVKIIEIRNADRLSGMTLGNESVIQLSGRVALFHEGAYMYCDSAFLYEQSNRLHAFGQIHIRQGDTLSLYGDSLFYDGALRKADIYGNVRLKDPTVNMTTSQLTYDRNSGQVSYPDSANIRNGTDRIRSRKGQYQSARRIFTFEENVHIQNPDYTVQSEKLDYETETDISWFYGPTTITSDQAVIYCEKGWHNKQTDEARFSRNAKVTSGSKVLIGDSLYYQRGRGYGQGFGNIQIHDSTEKITLLGQYAETWKDLNLYMVTGDAQMIQAFDSDSLFLHGDTLKGWEDTLGFRVVQCWNHVKFFKPDLQGACDSLFYTERDSLMRMFFTPVIWSDSSQMTGTYIHLKMDRGTLYHFDLLQKALLIAQDDTIRFNQLSGQNMRGFFHENDLVRLHVMEKGKLIYYPREEDGSLMGANTLSCRNITLSMANRQIQRISCQQKADGTLHPWETFTGPERLLDGFIWHVTDRPRKPVDIFIHRKGR